MLLGQLQSAIIWAYGDLLVIKPRGIDSQILMKYYDLKEMKLEISSAKF